MLRRQQGAAGRPSVPRLLAIVVLAGLWPLGSALPPLLLALAATLVVAAVAASDGLIRRAAARSLG